VGGAAGLRAARLGERLLDVLPIVAAVGYACEVSHCLYLCGVTWRKGDKGATNDMIAKSLEKQCRGMAARGVKDEGGFAGLPWRRDIWFATDFDEGETYQIRFATPLICAAVLNNLPRVLQLVHIGASLERVDWSRHWTALQYATMLGHEHVVRALLDGKFEGRGANADVVPRKWLDAAHVGELQWPRGHCALAARAWCRSEQGEQRPHECAVRSGKI